MKFHEDNDGDFRTWWTTNTDNFESSGLPSIFGTNTTKIDAIASQSMVPYTFDFPNGAPFAAEKNRTYSYKVSMTNTSSTWSVDGTVYASMSWENEIFTGEGYFGLDD